MRGPFKPRRDGSIDARLADVEADALRQIAEELTDALSSAADSEDVAAGPLRRLFPPAYADDAERQREFERFTRDELVTGKQSAARTVIASLDSGSKKRGAWTGVLDDETAHAWLGVMNDARLLLGTRLDVEDDMNAYPLPADDPRAPAHNLYLYLTSLEAHLIDALSEVRFGRGD